VLEERASLVGVSREVGAGGPQPDEQRGENGGGRCAENSFARKRSGAGGHVRAR